MSRRVAEGKAFENYGDRFGPLLLSRNAILSMVNSNRTLGKTWAFKRRAVRRFQKRGKKTLWLRVFQDEAKDAARKFFDSADLRVFCGVEFWDPKTKTGNIKKDGRHFLMLRGGKWIPFLSVYALSEADRVRAEDDVKIDTIVLDEYQKTPAALARYVGNPVTDFFDIFFSIKRRHEIRAFLLGNKESYQNPFLGFFGIQPPPEAWEGIRTWRQGTIALQQINNEQRPSAYEKRLQAMLAGTSYGAYIYDSKTKGSRPIRIKKPPQEAATYAQIDFQGVAFRIYSLNGFYYVAGAIDTGLPVFGDNEAKQWPKLRRLSGKSRPLFSGLINGVTMSRVYFDTPARAEAAEKFFKYLGIR